MENKSDNQSPARSEGVIHHTVCNMTTFKGASLSDPVVIRGLEWRILVTLRRIAREPVPIMGFFLQCGGNGKNSSWSCYAKAELKILSHDPSKPHISKKISHLFHESVNDWGINVKLWSEINNSFSGYVSDDCITLEAHVEADIPRGVDWDSKKLTGYVGLKNQGATCYMNSLLQTLFFTNQFRKTVYQIPFKRTESVSFALQRVFYGLQSSETPVDTRILTNSFGWKTSDTLRQQDVHEFSRLLIDKLEGMLENTIMKGTLSELFEGKMISTVKCRHVDYNSSITESFYDVQLNVIGKRNISESLDEYVAPEILDGDNRYAAGHYGLQEAEKKVTFSRFPPVLYLHLMRFHYDPVKDCSVKCNSRVEFPEQLNLDSYLLSADSQNARYSLHSVLVHSGNNKDGHYVVYINPELRGNWYIFDDDVVCPCSTREAINGNFGGESPTTDKSEECLRRSYRNAYVLVYIQQTQSQRILQSVGPGDVPVELLEKILEKVNLDELFSKGNLDCTSVHVLLEDSFTRYVGKNLFDPKTLSFIPFYIPKNALLKDFIEAIADYFNFPIEQTRIWPFNEKGRATFLNTENMSVLLQVRNTIEYRNPWVIFLELLPPDSGQCSLPPYDFEKHILIFFKVQLPKMNKIIYCGHQYILKSSSATEIIKIFNKMIDYHEDTYWNVHLKVDETMASEQNFSLQEGTIILFQEPNKIVKCENFKSVVETSKENEALLDVTICDLLDPENSSMVMKTYSNISYDEFIEKVADELNTEPTKLKLFIQEESSSSSDNILQVVNSNLKNLFQKEREPTKRKIYYKRLTAIKASKNKLSTKRLRESSNLK